MKTSLKKLTHLLLIRPLLKLLFGVNVFGRENLYSLDQYIIIANHNSHLDINLLFFTIPLRHVPRTHVVAAREYFEKSKILFAMVTYLFNPIWVRRGDPGARVDFMQAVSDVLDRGHNMIMFPEGTRGEPGELQTFKSGIGRVAEQYRTIPIVPIFMSGPERVLPKKGAIPIPIWNNVIIGPPCVFTESYDKITHQLEDMIRDLAAHDSGACHRKQRKRKPMRTVAVLGIDGSGKSTLSRNIAQALSGKRRVGLVSDTLTFYQQHQQTPTQPFIAENIRGRISRYAKNAKSLKLYKIPKMTELIMRDLLLLEIKKWYCPEIVVLDGSPLLNLIAWAVLYKEDFFNAEFCEKSIRILSSHDANIPNDDPIYKTFPELTALKRLGFTHLNLPDVVIFLDVDPNIAVQRINSRGEKKQVHETGEKLSKLRRAYQMVCEVVESKVNVPTSILKADQAIEQINDAAMAFVEEHLN